MKKQLPAGFDSWIQLYDHLQKDSPSLLKKKALRIIYGKITKKNRNETVYGCRIDTILINCWKEVQAVRLDKDHTRGAIHYITHIDSAHHEMKEKVITLLAKLEKNQRL